MNSTLNWRVIIFNFKFFFFINKTILIKIKLLYFYNNLEYETSYPMDESLDVQNFNLEQLYKQLQSIV